MRIPHLLQMKERGEKWAMLTAYDMYTAEIFDEAGIPVLLVGDSAGNNVYGFETTVPVTVDHLVPLCRAVTSSAKHAMVVADLPFGSYQASPQQALATATRFMKEGMAHAVKLEGGKPMVPEVELLVRAGIPVMGHIGFTPQSEHVLGGYKVQGRGSGADKLMEDALALEAAGCFAIVMEMVPAPVAAKVTEALRIPTIGIGAGPHCDAQVLVWQDMAGLRGGRAPRFVKKYADLRSRPQGCRQRVRRGGRLGRVPGRRALLRGLKPPARRRRRTTMWPMDTPNAPSPTRWSALQSGPEAAHTYRRRFLDLEASGEDVHGEARFITRLVPPPSRVLDAGCGFGRVASKLTRLGHTAIGVDADEHLIALAREDSQTRFFVADLSTLDLRTEQEFACVVHGRQRRSLPGRRHPPPGARPARGPPGARRLPRRRVRPGQRGARQGGAGRPAGLRPARRGRRAVVHRALRDLGRAAVRAGRHVRRVGAPRLGAWSGLSPPATPRPRPTRCPTPCPRGPSARCSPGACCSALAAASCES